jgi:hypothetical protein
VARLRDMVSIFDLKTYAAVLENIREGHA